MLFCLRELLLVAILCRIAPAHILKYGKDIVLLQNLTVTSSLAVVDAVTEGVSTQALLSSTSSSSSSSSSENPLSLERNDSVVVRTPLSVVQNWSLVCKQLCGAGLAGVQCASYCTTSVVPSNEELLSSNAKALLNSHEELICHDLCRLQLGDVACKCNSSNSNPHTPNLDDFNKVCSIFCVYNNATLAGCSQCTTAKLNVIEQIISKASGLGAAGINGGLGGGKGEGEGGSGEGEGEEVAGRDTATATTTVATTTPNWNELCVSLCKTGDGGSLCNCDLSPFFVKLAETKNYVSKQQVQGKY